MVMKYESEAVVYAFSYFIGVSRYLCCSLMMSSSLCFMVVNYQLLLDDPILEGYLHFRELATLEALMGNLIADAHNAVPVWVQMHYVLTHGGGNNGFPAFPFAPFEENNGDE